MKKILLTGMVWILALGVAGCSASRSAGADEILVSFVVELPYLFSMKKNTTITCRRYASPCGELLLGSIEGKLCLCNWMTGKNRDSVDRRLGRLLDAHFEEGGDEVLDRAARELDEYFAESRREFDIPLLFAGTDFQKAVWRELLTIPHGTTLSYRALSARLGMPKAVRAVAGANGANAISIFVPCHRVIGSDGTLTGYGGGLPVKKALLELEKASFKTISKS